MKWFDSFFEQKTRMAAGSISRRSALVRLGRIMVGTALVFPILPFDRVAKEVHAAKKPADKRNDDTACEYWRYCALDGWLCTCCGGTISSCPPGTEVSKVTWVGTCHNPNDGRDYLISYNDCWKTIINDLDSMYTYVIKILREKTQVYQQIISGTSKSELLFKGLVPDRYNIEIIRDENKNLIWDAGNYWKKKQPEQYKLIKGDKLRENRETELIISWKTGTISGNEPIQGQPGLQNNKIQQANRQ